jgi:Flp pilus assembly protein CpaB
VALALTLIVGCAAVGAYLYTAAGAKTAVVVVVRDVPEGRALQRDDLSTVAVAGGVTAISASHLDSVVGQAAAVHLLPNMLLQRSMVTPGSAMTSTDAQVGVVVKSGQIPADGLIPGDVVEVVALPAASASQPSPPQVLVDKARVFASRVDPAQTGGTLLTLVVPRDRAVAVAAASGAGQIALIKVTAQ